VQLGHPRKLPTQLAVRPLEVLRINLELGLSRFKLSDAPLSIATEAVEPPHLCAERG